MVEFESDPLFEKRIRKIKDSLFKEHIKKQIEKIIENPDIGKPMRFSRKGTREVYVGSFRLVYTYFKEENLVVFTDLYHKDEQ